MNANQERTTFYNVKLTLSKVDFDRFIAYIRNNRMSYQFRSKLGTGSIGLVMMIFAEPGPIQEIPFIQRKHMMIIDTPELVITNFKIAQQLEMLIKEHKGEGQVNTDTNSTTIYVSGKPFTINEIKDEITTIGIEASYKKNAMEIDYLLMELNEALKMKDKENVEAHKSALSRLVVIRGQIQSLLKQRGNENVLI